MAQEFVLGLGDVPIIDPTEEALDQAGRTIAADVCTMNPPSGLGYFGVSHLVPFQGPLPQFGSLSAHQMKLVVSPPI